MDLLHYTKWNPGSFQAGFTFSTDWVESNYWRATFAGLKHPADDTLLRAIPDWLLVNGAPLRDALRPLVDIAQKGRYAAECLKELAFEKVRREDFPSAPTRQRCVFSFDATLDPAEFLKRMPLDQVGVPVTLVRLRPHEGARVLRTDFTLLDCNAMAWPDLLDQARRYWAGVDEPTLVTEVLVEGRVSITDIVSTLEGRSMVTEQRADGTSQAFAPVSVDD